MIKLQNGLQRLHESVERKLVILKNAELSRPILKNLGL